MSLGLATLIPTRWLDDFEQAVMRCANAEHMAESEGLNIVAKSEADGQRTSANGNCAFCGAAASTRIAIEATSA